MCTIPSSISSRLGWLAPVVMLFWNVLYNWEVGLAWNNFVPGSSSGWGPMSDRVLSYSLHPGPSWAELPCQTSSTTRNHEQIRTLLPLGCFCWAFCHGHANAVTGRLRSSELYLQCVGSSGRLWDYKQRHRKPNHRIRSLNPTVNMMQVTQLS